MSDPSLYAIAQTLVRLRGRILRHPAYAKGVGGNPGDAEFETSRREIEEIGDGLLTALRYLTSRANRIDLKQQVAFKLPRDARWRERQSARDQRRALGEVYQLASDILHELAELEAANDRPDLGSILADLAKEGSQVAREAMQVIQEHGGHLDNVWIKTATMQNVPSALILALIVAFWLRRARDHLRQRR